MFVRHMTWTARAAAHQGAPPAARACGTLAAALGQVGTLAETASPAPASTPTTLSNQPYCDCTSFRALQLAESRGVDALVPSDGTSRQS